MNSVLETSVSINKSKIDELYSNVASGEISDEIFKDFSTPYKPTYAECWEYYEKTPMTAQDQLNHHVVEDWKNCLYPHIETGPGVAYCVSTKTGTACSTSFSVAAGVNRMQFQIWGAGGGTNQVCCCSITPYGPTGAYQLVKMDVTPGDTICVNAGCGDGSGNSQTQQYGAFPSYICKNGGWCFTAAGGNPNASVKVMDYVTPKEYINNSGGWTSALCMTMIHTDGTGGKEIMCRSHCDTFWSYCCGELAKGFRHPMSYAKTISWADNMSDACKTELNVETYGVNGMWPTIQFCCHGNTSSFGVSQPVPGADFDQCTCCHCYSTSACSGCQRSTENSFRCLIPGAGGSAGHNAGGTSCYGDWGRNGMVCVTCIG